MNIDMRVSADYWINKLQLTSHVEGGAFRETYRSPLITPVTVLPDTFAGDRNSSTAIYFLLKEHQFSAFHRISSDEVWHFYYGDSLMVYEIKADGQLIIHRLGNNPAKEESFQCVVEAGSWFASQVAEGCEYALVGCTVAPGFDFADFELARKEELIALYPQHEALITRLTRG
ncbi:MAG: cupin domain-containing protein [Chitinophagaceae bacterium]